MLTRIERVEWKFSTLLMISVAFAVKHSPINIAPPITRPPLWVGYRSRSLPVIQKEGLCPAVDALIGQW
jgi:hypothetical protein